MKHICYLTGCFSRTDGLIWERQGCSMVAFGYKVTYLVTDNDPEDNLNGVQILSSGYKPLNRVQRILFSKRHLYSKALEIDADIYQISEPELLSLGLKLKKRGKKVIFNMRENYPQIMLSKEYLPPFIRMSFSKWLDKYMSRSLKKFDSVFSVTPDLVEMVRDKWQCTHSFLLTNYPIVNTSYSLSMEDYLKRGNTICYVGTVYRVSRQEVFFQALEKIPNIKYLIAGVFWGSYQEELMKLPYWLKIQFQNGFKKSELEKIYSQASIANVLRDFSKTGSPNGSLGVIKVYESMEAALPIICTDVQIYRDMIDRYHCGLYVNPNDPKSIEDAIRFLIENKKEAYQMGQNGRQAVLKEYNWALQAKNYVSIINNILHN